MVRKALLVVTGISAVLVATAPLAGAQKGAPRVRVTSHPHSNFGNIQPSVSLSEDAYVLAVAIDRDGRVSVLSPVGPNDLIRFEAAKSLRLPEFFSGFSSARAGYYDRYTSRYASYIRNMTEDYSAGSVLVLASKAPFNFAAISDGPFWNEEAIRKLVRYRDPSSAVYSLGRAITSKEQSFGHDYLRFGANRYQVASADPCFGSSLYGYAGSGFSTNGYMILGASATRAGYQLMSIGSDGCGRIRYIIVPVRVLRPQTPVPVPVDSVAPKPEPTVRSASTPPGTYTGEDAVRVFETLKNRHSSDTYVGLPMSPILKEKEDGPLARPVTRDASPDRVESFERVRGANATPIERAPILREPQPRQQSTPVMAQPIIRSEPVVRSAPPVQRESKPAEVSSVVRDN